MTKLRKLIGPASLCLLAAALGWNAAPVHAQEDERPLIDVEFYDIEADIDFESQRLEAKVEVRFIPREETSEVIFELHNGLNVTRVVNAEGEDIPAIRYHQDFTVRLSFSDTLPLEEPQTVTFYYSGELEGAKGSPIQGISFASIDSDRAYLLYPARWFPVNGYGADRFGANIHITVDQDMHVVGSGLSTREVVEGRARHSFEFGQPSFPGSIAVMPEPPLSIESEGVTTRVSFPSAEDGVAQAYGDETALLINFYTEKFGPPYSSSLALVEVGEYSPNAYAAPGIIFMSPWGIGHDVNRKLLGSQTAQQWWRVLVSPGNRNHSWLESGLAQYSSLLFIEEQDGEEAFMAAVRDARINALTYDEIPMIQSGRLAEFSTELEALAGSKGTMVLHMLRWMIGDEAFFATLRQFSENFAWRSMVTDDFLDIAEAASGKNLQSFFIQWTESSGTPEFTQEYTIYRTGGGAGFKVLGKVKQDMDTFRMPVELKIETEGEDEYKIIDVVGTSSDYAIDTFGKPRRVILDPNNRILRFDDKIRVQVAIRKGEQLVELGYYNDSLIEYQKALDINRFSSLAHYRIGEVFFLQNNYQSAANEFREVLNGDQEPAWTEVWAHIHLGKIFDLTDQRERAVNEYQLAIRTRDDTQGAQDEARKYLENPYRRTRRRERTY